MNKHLTTEELLSDLRRSGKSGSLPRYFRMILEPFDHLYNYERNLYVYKNLKYFDLIYEDFIIMTKNDYNFSGIINEKDVHSLLVESAWQFLLKQGMVDEIEEITLTDLQAENIIRKHKEYFVKALAAIYFDLINA